MQTSSNKFFSSTMLLAALASTALNALSLPVLAGEHSGGSHSAAGSSAQPVLTLAQLKARAEEEPSDAKVRYSYGEGLKKAGNIKEASREFLATTEIDPGFYHAYHQLSVICSEKHLLDEAITRLTYLQAERPKDLLLRVALSELYEKLGENYQASKVLVELVYENAVPEKYLKKINNRIRFLQAKTKDSQSLDKAYVGDEQMDSNPPPLPEATLGRDLSISKVKEPKIMQGFGHATLLP
jgi:tetratricopeptide (TPR) repeat protein